MLVVVVQWGGYSNFGSRDTESRGFHGSSVHDRPVKPIAMPATYHGKGKLSLDSWLVHFAIVAEINAWNDDEQAKYMSLSLRDEALTALTESLPGRDQLVVCEIVEVLRENFDRPDSISTYRQKFQARRRKTGESLTALRYDVVKMGRQAYPDASAAMVDDLAKDQFITALESQHLRMQVRRGNPLTLEAAHRTAVEEEKLWKEEESQFSLRRNATITFSQSPETRETEARETDDRLQKMELQLQQLTQLVQELATTPTPSPRPPYSNRRNKNNNGACFQCGQFGHWRNQCTVSPDTVSKNQGN